ncbi:MAG: metal ABC transporter substrate-binding protein [Clostridiaceae bacterium]
MIRVIVLLTIVVILYGCNSQKKIEEVDVKYSEKELTLSILTTNDFLKNTVKTIVGDKHVVESIFSNNSYIENYNFTEDTYSNISKQDIFFYLGTEYEPYTEKLSSEIQRKNVSLVNTSRGANLIEDENNKINPYYFYSISNYRTILLNVKNSIQESDTKNRDFYEDNFKECLKGIDEINTQIKSLEENSKDTVLITSETRFDYFIKDINIKKLSLPNIFDSNNPKDVEKVKKSLDENINGKKYIIYLYNDENELKKFQGILNEKNVKIIKYIDVLNNYTDNMKKNLTNLQNAMNLSEK